MVARVGWVGDDRLRREEQARRGVSERRAVFLSFPLALCGRGDRGNWFGEKGERRSEWLELWSWWGDSTKVSRVYNRMDPGISHDKDENIVDYPKAFGLCLEIDGVRFDLVELTERRGRECKIGSARQKRTC